jgi:hypothetical protein
VAPTETKLAAAKQFVAYIVALWMRRPPPRSGGI